MTDRVRHLFVTLDRDFRDDDVQLLVDAIAQLRGVDSVELTVVTSADHLARRAVRSEVAAKLHDAIESVFAPPDGKS